LVYYLSFFMIDLQMSFSTSTYIGFVNSAIHSTQHISSTTWVIWSPTDELVTSEGIYLGPTTNNIVEYNAVIDLFPEVISIRIHRLVFRLDS
jgi:hypothetical protein